MHIEILVTAAASVTYIILYLHVHYYFQLKLATYYACRVLAANNIIHVQ